MFEQKCNILNTKIKNTKASLVFWPANEFPSSKRRGRLTPILPLEALSLNSLQLL